MKAIIPPPPRTPEAYAATLDGLDVENDASYHPGHLIPGTTWCNVFCADACARMGVTLARLLANELADWLPGEKGKAHGWLELVDRGAAVAAANVGQPTVCIWKNPTGPHGHIAMVRPSASGELRICQAGATNFNDAPFNRGFGSLECRFYTHA